uniref:Uncharacterized protein n=1 Tax=Plectus sambesii TaxID=2011161 RepID=A0A914VJJ2_9BILA
MGTPMNGASQLVAEDDLVRDLAVLIVAVSNENAATRIHRMTEWFIFRTYPTTSAGWKLKT